MTTSDLRIGKYKIREIATGDNYILDEGNKEVTIEKDKTTRHLNMPFFMC